MESMDTPPLGTFTFTLLDALGPRGAGALKTGFAEEEGEEDEQWGEDCTGEWGDCGGRLWGGLLPWEAEGGRPGGVLWGVFFFEGVPRRFFRRRGARPQGLALSSSPASESLASEWETGEEDGERDQEGVTKSCCCCRCWR